jgi:peptide/nickel transport system ATP-binding protein
VVARICDRVGVMYAGELVEQADKRALFAKPHHPYTVGLLRCLPERGTRHTDKALYSIPGRVPPLTALPQGCVFAPRCALADAACKASAPQLENVREQHAVRCVHWQTVVTQPSQVAFVDTPAPKKKHEQVQELLNVGSLKVYFQQVWNLFGRRPPVQAIDNVSFELPAQHTLGIVGESGCGKSTIARSLAGLTTITAGHVEFNGRDFTHPIEKRTRDALQQLQMVFQNPDSSLNPRHTIRETLRRPLKLFKIVPKEQEEETIIDLLRAVNLDETYLDRHPRQLSGGEKQRVAIARAFAGNPQLVLCDEPISSLDVSVQAAVLNLLQRLQREREVALLFISHDLNVVRYLSDEVAVIYLGRICEIGPTEAIFNPPYHPYTEALVSAIPEVAAAEKHAIRLQGTVPNPSNPPTGCRFHTRCPRKVGAVCEQHEPPAQTQSDGHTIYCHIPLAELAEMQEKG